MHLFLLFSLLFISNNLFAQTELVINKLETSNLSSQNINFFYIDNKNFSWIGTNQGLNRSDGTINNTFKSNPFDSTTINNNIVFDCFQLDNNGLYIKSAGGLDYYNFKNYNFDRISGGSKTIYHKIIDDKIIFSTEGNGIYLYNTISDKLENFKFDPRNPLSISSSNFSKDQNEII